MLVLSVASLLLSSNLTTSICFTTLTINPTPVANVVGLSKNSPPCRIMSASIAESDLSPAKLAEKASDKGFLT